MSRRRFLASASAGAMAITGVPLRSAEKPAEPFAQRGYYVTFMRMPAYGLTEWKEILDGLQTDGANLLLLWMGGAFRSQQFPITWAFNKEHKNVRHDFGRELIAHAHSRGIKVLLGLTPFGYDGVNQYPMEHPELKAVKQDGQPADLSGIYCWGWNLCPSQAESQQFMLEYTREMFFEFYPEADGLMIESSDYAICHCDDCRGRFFEREFEFVRAISSEVWRAKPQATVVVYPHYFSGTKVPGFDVPAATQQFNPRWTLFFTPHSAHLDARLIQQTRTSLWWDEAPALHDPAAIQRGAQRARAAGVTGYVPSLEAYSFVPTQREEGQQYLVGKRQVPLGFGWLRPEQHPYAELPLRVNRLAYREFSRQPDLPFAEFKQRLGRNIFGDAATPPSVEDLLELQRVFARERTWCQASPLVSPERVRAMKERGALKDSQLAGYRAALERVRRMEERHRNSADLGERELHRIAKWVVDQWSGANAKLLEP